MMLCIFVATDASGEHEGVNRKAAPAATTFVELSRREECTIFDSVGTSGRQQMVFEIDADNSYIITIG
jgi:hypothetical protein